MNEQAAVGYSVYSLSSRDTLLNYLRSLDDSCVPIRPIQLDFMNVGYLETAI